MQDDLTVQQDHDDVEVTLHVGGEVDLANASLVLAAGRTAPAETQRRALVLDLTDVTFIDSAGIGACVRLLKAARAEDVPARVHLKAPGVVRAFSLMGLAAAFDIRVVPL